MFALSVLTAVLPLCSSVARAAEVTRSHMAAAPAGRVETGVPAFTVFGPEVIGLSAAPTDLKLMPDGRVLVVNQRELAFTDGVRWEQIRADDGQPPIFLDVAVDRDGSIYYAQEGSIQRIVLGSDGRWRSQTALELPHSAAVRGRTMISVRQTEEHWYWFAGSGQMLNWRPGQTPQFLGDTSAIQAIFELKGDLYVSDYSSGGLFRAAPEGSVIVPGIERQPSETITAAVPFDAERVLVGTNFRGLQLFDGKSLRPFGKAGPLNSGLRINDLCAVGDGRFAAAIDTLGIVFFDADGRVLQTLEGSIDHRLARAERLRYAKDGVLWALLNQGIARIEFPSPVSRFEPLVTSGLTYAHPYRHAGTLWFLADGRALRATYDASGKLNRFRVDSPPGSFVFTLNTVDNDLFAATDQGIFIRTADSWTLVARDVVNARIGFAKTPAGELIYAARGEIGTVARNNGAFEVKRIPAPELGDNYNAIVDRDGRIWLELGNRKVGRIDIRSGGPELKIYSKEAGLTDGWVVCFVIDGIARFQVPDHVLRFDEAAERFVVDEELRRALPDVVTSSCRPATDPSGNLWYTFRGVVYRRDMTRPDASPVAVTLPFAPVEFTFEADGVIWFFGQRRLGRFDPHVSTNHQARPTALITKAQFPNSNRQLYNPGEELPSVPYSDNTLAFHFAAPTHTGLPVTFEVRLLGSTDHWVSTGNVGQAVFNRLKEGRYLFQVRAVTADGTASAPATVGFTLRPPWYRSIVAWVAYVVVGASMLAFVIWYPSIRQRRENERLELLVGKRTEELNATNQQLARQVAETTRKSEALAVSEERYRTLSAELETRVEERTAELSLSNRELQHRESLFRLIFEHAPVGISWKRADLDNLHHFNSTYRRILNLPTDTLPDFTALTRLIHPEDVPRQAELEGRITRGEADNGFLELRFNLPEGRLVWASFCVAVVRNDSGKIIQVIGIIEDITARKEAEKQLAATYKELMDASRMAGMAEVATGVLHNVGNVLNSLNVSSNLIAGTIRQSKAESLTKLSALLRERSGNLAQFLTEDPKGRLVPELLDKLAQASVAERDWLQQEVASMQKNIDHIKDIVAMQQSYATVLGVTETLAPAALFEDALRMNSAALSRHDVKVVREFLPSPAVCVEKGKVLQILTNVIRNAKYACDDGQQYGAREKVVTVRVEPVAGDRVRFIVRDTGIGIPPENLTRIFAHGFTTRSYGHGFGLHSSALAAREMKGTLSAESEGLGKGATFILEIPAAESAAASPPGTTPPMSASNLGESSE